MKKKFVRCETCCIDIPSGTCELATVKTKIDGKEYLFCCQNYAKRYPRKSKSKKRLGNPF